MKVALIGDVHANLPALEAVLEHAGRQGARDDVWNVGDFVGYGPFPDEVVKALRAEKTRSIIGNYDQKVLQVSRRKQEWPKGKPPEKWLAFKWAWENLSRDSRDFLHTGRAAHRHLRQAHPAHPRQPALHQGTPLPRHPGAAAQRTGAGRPRRHCHLRPFPRPLHP